MDGLSDDMNRDRKRTIGLSPGMRYLFIAFALFACATGPAQSAGPTGEQLKAALLFKLIKFVTWPTDTLTEEKSELVLCAPGRAPLDGQLRALQGKKVKGHRLKMVELATNQADTQGCQVLFLPKDRWGREKVSNRQGMLTISDAKGFANQDGMIELGERRKRVELRINLEQVREYGLQVDSQLLALATIVGGKGK